MAYDPIQADPTTAWRLAKQAGKNYNAADPASVARYQEAEKVANAVGLGGVDTTAGINKGVFEANKALTEPANMTADEIAAQSMEGVDKSSQLATPEILRQQTQGLGGDIDYGMQAAIANRQNKLYSSSLNELGQRAKMNAPLIQSERRRAALAGMNTVEELKNQAANTQLIKYQNDQAKRNALLNSILGLGGSIIGLATGGAFKPKHQTGPKGIGSVASGDLYAKSLGEG